MHRKRNGIDGPLGRSAREDQLENTFCSTLSFHSFLFLFSHLYLFAVFNSSFGFSKQSLLNIVQTFLVKIGSSFKISM